MPTGCAALCRTQSPTLRRRVAILGHGVVSAVLPTVSSCVSYYADRETWAALILLMGLSKAIINWGILAFYLDPANVPAAGNNLFVAARRIPFVAAVTEGVLAVLPYFPADEGLQQHAAIVTIAGVSAFVGSAINFKLMDLIFGEETPVRSEFYEVL
ncbi:hypothetical protein MTO96_030846 [Rhipicephalus appendiculatus]